MFSDLIVGFDGSGPAHDALALARHLALAAGAHPAVVYVRPHTALSRALVDGAHDPACDEEADRVLDQARAALGDVPGASFQASPAGRWRTRFAPRPRTAMAR